MYFYFTFHNIFNLYLFWFLYSLHAAPIAGVLTELRGPNGARTQIMLGGILATVGLCLTALATTWVHLALLLSLAGEFS